MKLLKLDELVDGWVYWAKSYDGYQLVEVHRSVIGVVDLYVLGNEVPLSSNDLFEGFVPENVRAPDGQCYSNPWRHSAEAEPGQAPGE